MLDVLNWLFLNKLTCFKNGLFILMTVSSVVLYLLESLHLFSPVLYIVLKLKKIET